MSSNASSTDRQPVGLLSDDVLATETDDFPVRFLVTGFGPFAGVQRNPTMDIVGSLSHYIKKQGYAMLSEALVETTIIVTAARVAQSWLNDTCTRLRDQKNSSSTTVVMLHLGVNTGARHFQLESCAWNEATFRVHDENGWKPTKEAIFENLPVDACVKSSLDVYSLVEELKGAKVVDVPILVSRDPGRFVCNYTYCYSLGKCSDLEAEGVSIKSLFLHVPSFEVVEKETQLALVVTLMEAIAKQVTA